MPNITVPIAGRLHRQRLSLRCAHHGVAGTYVYPYACILYACIPVSPVRYKAVALVLSLGLYYRTYTNTYGTDRRHRAYGTHQAAVGAAGGGVGMVGVEGQGDSGGTEEGGGSMREAFRCPHCVAQPDLTPEPGDRLLGWCGGCGALWRVDEVASRGASALPVGQVHKSKEGIDAE